MAAECYMARRDDYQTRDPELLIGVLEELIPLGTDVWEPFAGPNALRLAHALEDVGYEVTATGLPEQDFFEQEVPAGVTHVVSNPPFNERLAIMNRLNELGLSYCLLLPLSTLETAARQAALAEGHPLTLCLLPRRARFLSAEGEVVPGAPMACAWFCKIEDTPGGIVFAD